MQPAYTTQFTVTFHFSKYPEEDFESVSREIQNWLFTRIVNPHDSLKNSVPSVCGLTVSKN